MQGKALVFDRIQYVILKISCLIRIQIFFQFLLLITKSNAYRVHARPRKVCSVGNTIPLRTRRGVSTLTLSSVKMS